MLEAISKGKSTARNKENEADTDSTKDKGWLMIFTDWPVSQWNIEMFLLKLEFKEIPIRAKTSQINEITLVITSMTFRALFKY